MKKDWEIKSIQEISKIINGYAFESKDFKSTNAIKSIKITNVGVNEFIEETDNYLPEKFKNTLKDVQVREGNIVIALTRTIISSGLKVAVVPQSYDGALVNQRVAAIVPNEKIINQRYLYNFLTTNEVSKYVLAHVNTLMQPNLSINDLKKLPIYLPPLPEQQRIVAILDETFASIAKAKANAEQNLKNAKELFESYLQGVFENPKNNWEKKKLGDICGFVRGPFGGSLKKNIFKPDGYAVYEQQHAIYDQFDDLRYFIDEKKFNEMKRFELNSGDLIMSCSGTMGKIAIVPENIKKGIINQALLKLSPSKKVSNVFLKLWMQSESFQNSLKEYAGGAAIQNVASVSILKNIEIPLPDISTQNNIVQKVLLFSAETKRLEAIYQQKINDLEELKKSVLQKAFSGELKVSELGFDGLKDDRIFKKDKKEIIKSTQLKNPYSAKKIKV
jgi:type I restriction enzyme S subunit